MQLFPEYIPYREHDDFFEETFNGSKARLHLNPSSGHLRFLPIPSEEALSEYYKGVFSRSPSFPTAEEEFTPKIIEIANGVRTHVQRVASLPSNFIAHDVGCGFGALVNAFQKIGIRASGNEKNKKWVEAANPYCDFRLTADPLPVALEALGCRVDLFTILHVLEHLADPEATLSLLEQHMSDKGVLYICVPNAHSFRALIDGRRKDPCYMFPQHLNYFTALSLIGMLNDAGLEIVELRSAPLFESDASGSLRIHSALGMKSDEQVDGAAWMNAECANLLGGELYVLATSKRNSHCPRDSEAQSKAERAFQNFNTARGRCGLEHRSTEYLEAINEKLSSLRQAQAQLLDRQAAALEAQSTTLEKQSAALKAQSATLEGQSAALEAQTATLEGQSAALEIQSAALKSQGRVLRSLQEWHQLPWHKRIFSKWNSNPNQTG